MTGFPSILFSSNRPMKLVTKINDVIFCKMIFHRSILIKCPMKLHHIYLAISRNFLFKRSAGVMKENQRTARRILFRFSV